MLGLFWRGGLLTDIPYVRTCICEHECSHIERGRRGREREREAGGELGRRKRRRHTMAVNMIAVS
jgi:hypothetical protein